MTIVKRLEKGTELSHTELDGNFDYLNTKVRALESTQDPAIAVLSDAIASTNAQLALAQSAIAALESAPDPQPTDLTPVLDSIVALAGRLTVLENEPKLVPIDYSADITDLQTRVIALEAKPSLQAEDLVPLQTGLVDLDARVTVLEAAPEVATESYEALRKIGEWSGVFNLAGSHKTLGVGVDLTQGDYMAVTFRMQGSGDDQTETHWVNLNDIKLGSDRGFLFCWYYDDFVRGRIDNTAAMQAGHIKFLHYGTAFTVVRVAIFAEATFSPIKGDKGDTVTYDDAPLAARIQTLEDAPAPVAELSSAQLAELTTLSLRIKALEDAGVPAPVERIDTVETRADNLETNVSAIINSSIDLGARISALESDTQVWVEYTGTTSTGEETDVALDPTKEVAGYTGMVQEKDNPLGLWPREIPNNLIFDYSKARNAIIISAVSSIFKGQPYRVTVFYR